MCTVIKWKKKIELIESYPKDNVLNLEEKLSYLEVTKLYSLLSAVMVAHDQVEFSYRKVKKNMSLFMIKLGL